MRLLQGIGIDSQSLLRWDQGSTFSRAEGCQKRAPGQAVPYSLWALCIMEQENLALYMFGLLSRWWHCGTQGRKHLEREMPLVVSSYDSGLLVRCLCRMVVHMYQYMLQSKTRARGRGNGRHTTRAALPHYFLPASIASPFLHAIILIRGLETLSLPSSLKVACLTMNVHTSSHRR